MSDIPRPELARRAGVEPALVDRLVDLGLLTPADGDLFSSADVRVARFMQTIERYGVALDSVAQALRDGHLTVDAFELESFDRFSPLSHRTFREVSAEMGIPVEIAL